VKDQNQEYSRDEWKNILRSEIVTASVGNAVEKARAYTEVGYYYQCFAPASLYKYYPDTQLCLDNIKNNKMWYSAPINFNDVFDCDIAIDEKKVFEEALKLFPDKRGVRPGSKIWKDFRKTMKQQLKDLQSKIVELRNTTGVSCLTEADDSLLMWAHYANNHRGICVEYDLMEINSVLNFTAIPVVYSKERSCFNFFDPSSIEKDTLKLFIHSLTSKSPEWDYEKEWRIIRDKAACSFHWNADKKGALLDMIQPRSITLGCMAQPEYEQEVKKYCSSNGINLYKMEKDITQYKLNRKVLIKFDEED